MLWTVRILGLFLLTVTLLPLISTGKWYVRWWDFPRLQIAVLLLLPISFAIVLSTNNVATWEPVIWAIVLTLCLFWQVSHVIQFSPVWKTEVATLDLNHSTIRLMVSNLDKSNSARGPVAKQLSDEQPDVLMLIEYDEAWQAQLKELRDSFSHHHEEVREDGLGMAIWSNRPVLEAETRFLVSKRRPTIWARIKTFSNEIVNFVCVHPTPPGLLDTTGDTRRDSRVRDAELILIAKEIANRNDEAWVVAGDFNDVAWSHTTRLFKRVSGLKDPRIGRSFMGTYMADFPPLRCPIDHVFLSDCFTISDLARKKISGSDHFAVLASVSLLRPLGVTPAPEGNDEQDAKMMIEEGISDAEDRGVDSEETGE
jgi:endonuclease/exonuclease/phosphatase (EEP) superfamily protein YafD